MMERYIAEKFIPQEFLDAQPEVENHITKELSETLVLELLRKYKPGQLVMVQLPRLIPSTNNPPWAGKNNPPWAGKIYEWICPPRSAYSAKTANTGEAAPGMKLPSTTIHAAHAAKT